MSESPKQEASVKHLRRVQCSDVFRSGTNFVPHAIFTMTTMLAITAIINRKVDPQSFNRRLLSPSLCRKLRASYNLRLLSCQDTQQYIEHASS